MSAAARPTPPVQGICYLAGAGPGDLGLVTLKVKEVVEQAEVLIYDYLCNPAILGWAPPGVEIIYAGKKAGQHTLKQEEIDALLVEKTRAGKRVVRLKGGDPFLFGRGGEEAEALAAAGLKFEIIPGVTSAIAAPAYAGIPVTHRDHTSQLTISPGTKIRPKQKARWITRAWRPLPDKSDAHGRRADRGDHRGAAEPWRGSDHTGRARALGHHRAAADARGTLGDIAQKVTETGFSAPAVAVIGDVVKLRDTLNWFETRPLYGKRIVVTRTRKQAGGLSAGLQKLGADVSSCRRSVLIRPGSPRLCRTRPRCAHLRVARIHLAEWGHRFLRCVLQDLSGRAIDRWGEDRRNRPGDSFEVREYHLAVDLQPQEFVAEGVVAEFQKIGSVENQMILIARAEQARDVLPQELTKLGAIVDIGVAYRTVPETEDVSGALARFKKKERI
jgi:uroporphyrinogen III methyltransferase/synthase